MPIHAIDHVQLAMPFGEENAARAFYAGVLGFAEIPKPENLMARGGIWFRSGKVAVHMGVDSSFLAAAKAHPAFICTDYAKQHDRLREGGISPIESGRLFGGLLHCYVCDPFGNRLELIDGLA